MPRAFYGGLADLLVTAALDGASSADEVEVAIGLDRWWPTAGTRATGARNTVPRLILHDGHLAPLPSPAPTGTWAYPLSAHSCSRVADTGQPTKFTDALSPGSGVGIPPAARAQRNSPIADAADCRVACSAGSSHLGGMASPRARQTRGTAGRTYR